MILKESYVFHFFIFSHPMQSYNFNGPPVSDQGEVEIISLHRKWKNEKTKNIVLLENHLQRELYFWKCKISLH